LPDDAFDPWTTQSERSSAYQEPPPHPGYDNGPDEPVDAPDAAPSLHEPSTPTSEDGRLAAQDKQPWRAVDVRSLNGVTVPERRWIVPNWLPVRTVTLIYADGGIGKTLLALQLMAAAAARGRTWCGLAVEPCRSVGLFTEDDTAELHIRMEAIRLHYGLSWDDMADMCPIDATGQDNVLVNFDGGRMTLTPRFYRLREQALDIGARLVVIDTAATTFGGNENDRREVTLFIGSALTGLAQDIDGAVLLNAHPSLSGINSTDLRSGSTGWSNSARSRLALTRPVGADGKPALDSPDRSLTRQKANGASAGEIINLRWQDGVLICPNEAAGYSARGRKDAAEQALLAGIRTRMKEGKHSSANPQVYKNYAPMVINLSPEGCEFRKAELKEAMENLLRRGSIKVEPYRKNSQDHEHLIIVGEIY
jgi:RecA-family ATPase